MRRLITLMMAGGLFTCIFGQQILKTNLEGVAVQSFVFSQAIDGFTVSGPDDESYVYLVAHAGSESGEFVRTRLQGLGFHELMFPQGEHLVGFDTRGPDHEGYVYLRARGSDGSTGDIVRSRLAGVAVHSFTTFSSDGITSLEVCGPDENGYVYLAAGTDDEEPEPARTEAPDFALAEIGLCTDAARISYSLARPCRVSVKIYDASGRVVANLVDADRSAGAHGVSWDTSDQIAGVYFITMDAGSFKATRKLVVVK